MVAPLKLDLSKLVPSPKDGPAPEPRLESGSVIVTSLREAELVLDQNERRGCRNQVLTVLGPSQFLIRWQKRAARIAIFSRTVQTLNQE